eukprot:7869227-Lingulodinium_polyedra.AAC.1
MDEMDGWMAAVHVWKYAWQESMTGLGVHGRHGVDGYNMVGCSQAWIHAWVTGFNNWMDIVERTSNMHKSPNMRAH